MIRFAVVGVELPQSSVAVKVTGITPPVPQSSAAASKLKSLVQVTSLQSSCAIAPPLASSQSSTSSIMILLSIHVTVRSEASGSIVGGVISRIVNLASV